MIEAIILCGVIVAQQILHYIERKELCDRLMSRDVTEYRAKAREKPVSVSKRHEQIMRRWREPDADFADRSDSV